MNKGINNIVGPIIVTVILMGGIGGYMYLKNKQAKPISITNAYCSHLEKQISEMMKTANYCNINFDCAISNEIHALCECWWLINKNTNLSIIKEEIKKYNESRCGQGVQCNMCMPVPQQGDIKCVNNKCVDDREQSSG